MSHFAQIENGRVTQIIVAEQEVIDTGLFGDPATWRQCSYNTRGNVHVLGGTPLRGNYPAPGYHYDQAHDVFYAPQPYASWTLNTTTWLWTPPVPYPEDTTRPYVWNENTQVWDAL